MQKIKSKKGFTLAELLIVVAVIAVLTAIAVPLFVGALNDAENKVKEANIRAVRGLAIAEILGKNETYRSTTYNVGEGTTEYGWIATGVVDKSGNVSELKIQKASTKLTTPYPTTVAAKGDAACEKNDNKYYVAVYISETDAFTNDIA